MTSSTHRLEQQDGRLQIRLEGELSTQAIAGLKEEVEGLLDDLPRGSEVLLDLTEVTAYEMAACRRLAGLQRRIGAQGCRTAYLTDRARIHGAAWWIVHASRDQNAMPVSTLAFAERWFDSDTGRLDELEHRSNSAAALATQHAAQEAPGR